MTAEPWPRCKTCKQDLWHGLFGPLEVWGCATCGTRSDAKPVEQLELFPEEQAS